MRFPLMALTALAAIAPWSPSLTHAAQDSTLICGAAGLLARPAVPDAATARSVFLAVEKAIAPHRNARKFPAVGTRDEGAYWTVYRYAPPRISGNGAEIHITEGGGQLELGIAKCDGAITHAALSR